MTPTPRRLVAAAAALAALLPLSACAEDDGAQDDRAAALAVARDYLDAIADRDPEAAKALTSGGGGTSLGGAQVASQLASAEVAITDPWATVAGPVDGTPGRARADAYRIDASWTLDGLTGGGSFTVAAVGTTWRVVEPLAVSAPVYGDGRSVDRGRIGDVVVRFGAGSSAEVVGYPGVYLFEADDPAADVAPVRVVLGAASAPQWWESLRRLQPRSEAPVPPGTTRQP
ncbi:hypothetical protein [Nocardioides litoris]|uniref:hypothetical protein n=1 Tax=Nocardioides litoris TaxID=1926648 RepID=UPI00111D7655|nr:hypothetical protein [Nocardioides litoris]